METQIIFPSSFEANKPERIEKIKECVNSHLQEVADHNYTHYVFFVAYNSKGARVLPSGENPSKLEKKCKVTFSDQHGISVASE